MPINISDYIQIQNRVLQFKYFWDDYLSDNKYYLEWAEFLITPMKKFKKGIIWVFPIWIWNSS